MIEYFEKIAGENPYHDPFVIAAINKNLREVMEMLPIKPVLETMPFLYLKSKRAKRYAAHNGSTVSRKDVLYYWFLMKRIKGEYRYLSLCTSDPEALVAFQDAFDRFDRKVLDAKTRHGVPINFIPDRKLYRELFEFRRRHTVDLLGEETMDALISEGIDGLPKPPF